MFLVEIGLLFLQIFSLKNVGNYHVTLQLIKISPTLLPLPLFININWHVTNNVCGSFCVETIHFLYFVQFDLQELQSFCFQSSSCHSFNTSSFLCEYRSNNCIEFITGQKSFFSSHGISHIEGVKTTFGLWSFLIIFTKQLFSSGLKIKRWLE